MPLLKFILTIYSGKICIIVGKYAIRHFTLELNVYMANTMDTSKPACGGGHEPSRQFVLMFFSLLAIGANLPSKGFAANSLSQFGITWTFDKELSIDGAGDTYQYGQFANGDYWVVGPVAIVGIDPPSTEIGGRTKNGTMLNPNPTENKHGYDSNALYLTYDAAINVALDVSATSPLDVAPSSSLVSTISVAAAGHQPQVQTAAILTVLASAPAADSFRPAYCGSDKTINFNKSDLNYNVLSNLTAVDDTPELATVEGYFEKPWIDHRAGYGSRQLHPVDNMPDYGTDIARRTGIGAVFLNLDYTNEQKETLLVRYVQLGIDNFGIVNNGGLVNFQNDGGHQAGRKMPIVFAGVVLNDTSMKNIGVKSGDYLYDGEHGAGDAPADYIHFQEDDQTFYAKAADAYSQPYALNGHGVAAYTTGTVKVTNGSAVVEGVGTEWVANVTGGQYFGVDEDAEAYNIDGKAYLIDSVDSNTQITLNVVYRGDTDVTGDAVYQVRGALYYGHGAGPLGADWTEFVAADIGLPCWGLVHSTYPVRSSPQWGKGYQVANAQVWGGLLAAWIMPDIKTLWNHDALFDYMDRFMAEHEGEAVRQTSDFLENMWDTYRADYGDIWTAGSGSSNSAPTLNAIGSKSASENALLTITISATDADSDTITYSASGTAIDAGAVLSGQTFSWTPSYEQADTYQVTFVASDSQAQDSETINITVNNVNRAPVLNSIGNKSVNENSALSFSVSATDADSDTITYSAQDLPSGATFASQSFTWTPSYEQAGTYQVTFIASDTQAQDSETITITVNNVNRAPVLDAIGSKSVDENSTLSFSVSASDADDDTITYSVESLPSGAVFVGQAFTWTPGYNQAGNHQVTFTASDGQAQDSETIAITVSNTNRAPVLSTIGNQSVYTDDSLTFTVSATDPDSDTITYSTGGLPSGATFANQTFSWTPNDGQIGSYEVTFIASDDNAQDSESITITVSADTSAPSVNNCSPAADAIQVPINNLVTLHIVDSGKGVDANSITIKVNNNTVYTGNTADYSSEYGHCRRVGTKADYRFIYQANDMFDFDQTVAVTVNATDIAGNVMSEYSYSFQTEMRSFGQNKKVNSGSDNSSDTPSTVRDSSGDIWVAWHAGQTGSRDVYIGKLTAGANNFDSSVQLTSNNTDQCNAAIAVDADDKLYVVWQDNRRENWDIYISTSTDGINWATEKSITDSNDNQVNPAIVVDSSVSKTAYVVWQDDQAGNQDIYVASSSNDFVTTISRITSDSSDQTEPAVVADSDNTIYVVWTDARGGSNDIYGAASNNGPWTNVAIVSNANNQSSPAIATEAIGSILHLLWVDDTSGNRDIYYASSNGLPASPLTGSSIIDDTSSADQRQPTVTVTGSTGNNLKVFACWQDERNTDTDLYFVEAGSSSKTNALIGDDGSNANQSEPAIGADIYGHPYMVWADSRNTSTDIYYAGSTFIESNALASKDASTSLDETVGTEPANIDGVNDVSIIVPAGAYACDIKITISRVKNPPEFSLECFSLPYEFGPSGINFDQPVTITIPYEVSNSDNPTSAYWYNPLTGTLSQQGITDIENIEISSTLHALRFKTTHLTQFIVGGSVGDIIGGGGGGGGGCAMSPNRQGNIVEFLLPYVGYIMVMIVITCRDARKRKARNTARSEC